MKLGQDLRVQGFYNLGALTIANTVLGVPYHQFCCNIPPTLFSLLRPLYWGLGFLEAGCPTEEASPVLLFRAGLTLEHVRTWRQGGPLSGILGQCHTRQFRRCRSVQTGDGRRS